MARVLGLVGLWLASVAVLIGPMRAMTQLALPESTWVAVAVSLAIVLVAMPARFAFSGAQWGCMVLGVLFALLVMNGRRHGVLIGWAGSDAGVHVAYQRGFIDHAPGIYAGFVSFYGFTWLIEQLFHLDVAQSFGVGLLVVSGTVGLVFGWIVGQCASRGVALVLALLLACGIALPVLSYYAVDGFFGQIWILLPIVAIWLIEQSELSRGRRGVLLGIAFVIARYAYGLVLGDLCVLGWGLIVAEAARARGTERRTWGVVAVVALIAVVLFEWRFFRELSTVVKTYGWFVRHDFNAVLWGTSLALVGLIIAACTSRAIARLVYVPLCVVVCNTATIAGLLHRYGNDHYYIYKYDFHALVLLSVAAVPVIVGGITNAPRVASRVAARVAALLVFIGALVVGHALAPMRLTFEQRLVNVAHAPEVPNEPMDTRALVDRNAVRIMRDRLRIEHAEFGGYIVAWGPMFNFVNAMFDRLEGGYFHYHHLDRSPGHCIFWTHTEGVKNGMWKIPHWITKEEQLLDHEEGVNCMKYVPTGEVLPARDLCSVCFRPLPQTDDQADR